MSNLLIKERLINEWLPANQNERPKIANDICNDLAWELDISKIPYNPSGIDVPKEEWQWKTKSECEKILKGNKRKGKDE